MAAPGLRGCEGPGPYRYDFTESDPVRADRPRLSVLRDQGNRKDLCGQDLAKAVNCEHPEDGSPCGECPSCQQIQAGTSLNVVEIDAASNNGVENIREIRDQVQYPPTEGKYRVYIIDEVHMLSTGAFNALLKTLEEPPSYVIFILATTEVHKIPITVLSRCQRYDFRRITVDTIADRLKELTDAEGMAVEDRALRYVAKAGDGSMRDALSLLDQCAAFHYGETLTYENVLDVLGAVDNRVFRELFGALRNGQTKECILRLEEMVIQGRELSQFVADFIWFLRNLLILKTADEAEELLDMSEDNLKQLREDAALADENVLMRYIRVFSEVLNQIRFAAQKRVLVELAFIRLTKPRWSSPWMRCWSGWNGWNARWRKGSRRPRGLETWPGTEASQPCPRRYSPRPRLWKAERRSPGR